MKSKTYLQNNKGVTMVELIVSFALLAIFLSVVTMTISDVMTTYFRQQKLMSMYTVADTVMGELRDEIATMQGSELKGGAGKGYIKLRDESGAAITAVDANGKYTGTTIEFLQSNTMDGPIMMQIDTLGAEAPIIDSETIVKTKAENINPKRLTMRYYLQFSENNLAYKGLYLDKLCNDTKALSTYNTLNPGIMTAGTRVIWDGEERLPETMYQGYDVKISYSVDPKSVTVNGENKLLVTTVEVTVQILEEGTVKYEKVRTIGLENPVYYKTEATTYSDK